MDKLALMHDENLKLVFLSWFLNWSQLLISSRHCLAKLMLNCRHRVWLAAQAELCMIISHPCLVGCKSAVVITKF